MATNNPHKTQIMLTPCPRYIDPEKMAKSRILPKKKKIVSKKMTVGKLLRGIGSLVDVVEKLIYDRNSVHAVVAPGTNPKRLVPGMCAEGSKHNHLRTPSSLPIRPETCTDTLRRMRRFCMYNYVEALR